ncbi:hypothetical protein MWN33_13420 [Starkeya koreensis]|uniref:Helix-turn-helix domain-containing protein n=1 Tax=Ancylobacter koreensis TaxID=266121 RepID=A0ABT0DP27_9HYPH|nr:hypothetical protein [Ancylobacter koreensis]MCK0209031.1 hypothetical protein [Ancylobacter koreensis]
MSAGRSAPSGRNISPAALVEARRLYEETAVPVESIAVLLGVHKTTIFRHARREGWRSRRLDSPSRPLALAGRPAPPPASAAVHYPTAAEAGGETAPRRALIGRLIHRIEAEIAAIERLIGLGGGAAVTPEASPADAERAARTLAVLVRTLRELAALDKAGPDGDEDDASRDADAFRRELGDTLERVLAGREAS